ncbi:TIGR00730 family Rossman fold protein [Dongia sp.]|uniref:LOG family protein n=1 Tax=Dongia sp. TaxID=1977262 RepID=UPI0035B2F9D5
MTPITSLCVYCGSSRGTNPAFFKLAQELGGDMAQRGIRLIYGGGRVGLMGACADAVMAGGGEVIGIIPQHLQDLEVGHTGLTELKVVDNMHTRKRMMFDLSDAFCVLPGGLGTLEELFEVVTWRQLGIHDKPIIVLNADGYWDRLVGMIDGIIDDGFAKPAVRQYFSVANSVGRLFDLLAAPADTQEPDFPERL